MAQLQLPISWSSLIDYITAASLRFTVLIYDLQGNAPFSLASTDWTVQTASHDQ